MQGWHERFDGQPIACRPRQVNHANLQSGASGQGRSIDRRLCRYSFAPIATPISFSLIPKLYVLRRRGSAADTPVSQPSNSIGDKGVVSTSLGSSIGFEL